MMKHNELKKILISLGWTQKSEWEFSKGTVSVKIVPRMIGVSKGNVGQIVEEGTILVSENGHLIESMTIESTFHSPIIQSFLANPIIHKRWPSPIEEAIKSMYIPDRVTDDYSFRRKNHPFHFLKG